MQKNPMPIHPFLFASFPVLFLFAENIGQLSLSVILVPLVIILALTLFLYMALNFLVKDPGKASLVVSLFLALFFSYGHIYQAVRSSGFIISNDSGEPGTLLLFIMSGVFLAGTYCFLKMRKATDYVTRLLNAVSSFLVIISLLNIASYEIAEAGVRKHDWVNAGSGPARAGLVKQNKLPNIYFIILDAYAGQDVLKEFYGYDNSEFIRYLEDRGFFIAARSKSNYCQTALSLASTLNLRYLDKLQEYFNADSNDTKALSKMIKNNVAFDFLRKYGYRIAVLSSGRYETEIDTADILIKPVRGPNEFENMLINMTPIPLVTAFFGSRDQIDIYRDRILTVFDRLADISKAQGPLFVFAYLEIPHPPFVFGPEGEKVKADIMFRENDGDWLVRKGRLSRADYVKHYVNQLIFVNKKTQAMLDAVLGNSEVRPIIILQADHGPRSMLSWEEPDKTNFRECTSILSAYLVGRDCRKRLYGSITPVNNFRVIFSCYFGAGYEALEDREYFSTAKYPFRFRDVTDRAE